MMLLATFGERFYDNFIDGGNWLYVVRGLRNTLIITVFAALLGIAIGFLVAVVRASYDTTKEEQRKGLGKFFLKLGNSICQLYLTVIRGTPSTLQLLIMYFLVFGSTDINKMFVAVMSFGINSGAYVAEIFRSGIMSVERGQFEAGRSLGFSYTQTMRKVIMPQAFKNVLPAIGNEFIVLLKETSICGYIALEDLTRAAYIIRSDTFDSFMPLMAAAFIYLILVMIIAAGVSKLERRLAKSDH